MLSDRTLQVHEWKARLLMEESLAIKFPSISYHLNGTKKVRHVLAKPNRSFRRPTSVGVFGNLGTNYGFEYAVPECKFVKLFIGSCCGSRFLDNKDDIAKLRECFVGFWRQYDTQAVKNVVEQR
ncbi:glutathione synthetase, chloroplastic-like protein [Tanacetum coccineum]